LLLALKHRYWIKEYNSFWDYKKTDLFEMNVWDAIEEEHTKKRKLKTMQNTRINDTVVVNNG